MSSSTGRPVEIDAPAKLNLGLEVIGRREDGFHEIATIFLAIDVYDHLRLRPSHDVALSANDPDLAGADNLALRALHALRDETGHGGGAHIDLRKGIPTASGLGGASSDAAATLIAARDLWHLTLTDDTLLRLAARLGSDVPFFIHGGCAVGRGRGELLTRLPVPRGIWFVVVAPNIAIPKKTASLYARLGAEDFSDGDRIGAQAARIASGHPLDPEQLGNAFSRPLYALEPRLADLPGIMRDAGASSVAISGAGPAHYAPVLDSGRAETLVARLKNRLGNSARVLHAKPAMTPSATSRPL